MLLQFVIISTHTNVQIAPTEFLKYFGKKMVLTYGIPSDLQIMFLESTGIIFLYLGSLGNYGSITGWLGKEKAKQT